jgi:hypothetical protein
VTADRLIRAYRRTSSFYANIFRGRLSLRIGEPHAELDFVARRSGARSWGYATAYNPGSSTLSEDENVSRQDGLENAAAEGGFLFFHGEGVGDDGQWFPEPSLLIIGITRAETVALGRRFGQRAIVYGEAGGSPQLIACE